MHKKKKKQKKQKLFIVYILGYFQTIINTWLVSLSTAAAHYTSNKPHHKSGWYVWAYTALQINDNSKRHHVASTWEGIFPWHTEGESGSVFFVPSRLLNEMLPLCTLWVQLFNQLQLARLVTGWTTVTKEYRLKCWVLLERGLLVVISRLCLSSSMFAWTTWSEIHTFRRNSLNIVSVSSNYLL